MGRYSAREAEQMAFQTVETDEKFSKLAGAAVWKEIY
jgi:hypothetical protein